MLRVHFESIVFHCRIYAIDPSDKIEDHFKNKDRYVGIFDIQVHGDKAYISGYHGDYNKSVRSQIKEFLLSIGIKRTEFETATGHTYDLSLD
jgi:hypothetical protein